MGRKKVQLTWIENDKARAITLRKRRDVLVKKVKELTILCDIMACLIIFSPNEAEPIVWPSVEMGRGLLADFFALPMFEQKKKEMTIESFLKEKTKRIHEKFMKSHKKDNNELMMQLHHGRGINDLNINEIYGLLSFTKDKIMLWRNRLDFMQFSPLRDPLLPPFDPANDAFLGGSQDDKTGKVDGTTRIINIDTLRENKSHYLIDRWFFEPIPVNPAIYQQIGNENPNPNSFRPYQGSSSNGNPSLEMQPVYPQGMTFPAFIDSASQPLQHHNMNNNPIMATNQPNQNPFDIMSRELEVQEEGNNNHNSQFYRSSNTITTNDDLRQEPPPNEVNAREDNDISTSFDINRFLLDFTNRHF